MPSIVDYFNTGDETNEVLGGAGWQAQTFTASKNYSITLVKVKLLRVDTSGTATVSIRATDNSTPKKPAGGDLTSGTYDISLISNSVASMISFTLPPYALTSGTRYAIVVRTDNSANRVRWSTDENASGNGFTGGTWGSSGDSGSTWTMDTNVDAVFETYEALTQTFSLSDAIDCSETYTTQKVKTFSLSDSISLSEAISTAKTKWFILTDSLNISESISSTIVKIFSNLAKHISTWINQDKSR